MATNPARLRQSSLPTLLSYLTIALLFTFTAAQDTYQGCYAIDSSNTLVLNDTSIYQSEGRCNGQICGPEGYAVYGMTSSQCWCGNSIPGTQVSGDHCTIQCPGYPNNTCGGVGYLSVFLTGVGKLKGNAATTILPSSVSSTATNSPSGTVYIAAGETTITQVPTESSQSNGGGGGVSGGAAAGIVIGVLALVAIGVGAFFFVRRRRRIEYQREGSNFGSSPGSLNRPFGTDQRLEPGMVQKRESVGSLADERDYSRKILRVTNPDGS